METKCRECVVLTDSALLIAIEPDKEAIIENILDENKCNIKEKAWQSKYNSYVVYDYKPFNVAGFILNIEIIGDINKLQFLKMLIEQRLEHIYQLEKCYKLECVRC